MTRTRCWRLFSRLFFPWALLLVAGLGLYGRAEVEREQIRLQAQETLNVGLGRGALARVLEDVTRDLRVLAGHSALRRVIESSSPSPSALEQLAEDFVHFSRTKGLYDQIRWLDETGRERVRVDYQGGAVAAVPRERLQDKSRRYYFRDTVDLEPGEIFVSPLDLNIERGQIERPYKPMIRLGTPVAEAQGKPRGILLLNYLGQHLLGAFADATLGIRDHIAVVNRESYWLKAPHSEEEWGFMFQRPERTLEARFPEDWARLREADEGQRIAASGLWTWQTVYPLLADQHSSTGTAGAAAASPAQLESREYFWKVVAHVPAETLWAIHQGIWIRLAGVGGLLLGLVGLGSWQLARSWAAQAEAEAEVRQINAHLELLVTERTQALKEKVAELDRTNATLAQKNEEMENMIYIASHDLRSPLVNIQGFGQRLGKAFGDIRDRLTGPEVPAVVREDLARLLEERIPTALGFICSSSQKMDALINSLLRLSRAGRVAIRFQSLDLKAMIEEILKTLAIQLQEAEGRVVLGDLPPCLSDATQLNPVFTNLLDNAIKYRDPKRPLVIRLSGWRQEGRVYYEIADNGLGVAAEHQAKIWQLFHRLEPGGKVSGEGIGLTLVRRLLDRLDGGIGLESQPGSGSRFLIDLPAVSSDHNKESDSCNQKTT